MQPGLPQVRVVCESPPWTMVSAAARSWRSRICLLIYIIVSFRENFVKRKVTFEHQLGNGNRVFPCPQASFLRRKVASTPRPASRHNSLFNCNGGDVAVHAILRD